MAKKKETKNYREFYKSVTKRFFDENLLTTLYENEDFALCNAANQTYLLFPYTIADYSIMLNKVNAIYCVLNYYSVITSIARMSDENFRNTTAIIDDKLFDVLKKKKAETDLNGPSEYVDLKLDEVIIKYGRDIPPEEYRWIYEKYLKK